jgi:hypothetical protein
MSVSKRFLSDKSLVDRAVRLYLAEDKPTMRQVAERMGTTEHNVQAAVRAHVPRDVRIHERSLRVAREKFGSRNPMHGRTGEEHHNYKGACSDHKGYLTVIRPDWYESKNRRVFQHHVVMAQALGLRRIPQGWDVHHIDKNGENNDLENLALVTNSGHQRIHGARPELSGLNSWEKHLSMMSKSKEITAMLQED